MKTKSKALSILLAACLALPAAGCTSQGGSASSSAPSAAPASSSAPESAPSSEAAAGGEKDGAKIVSEPLTLSYWSPISQKVSNFVSDYNELVPYIELEKRTGIHMQFQHPPVGQETEQLNIMLASNELPDLIYWNWQNLPGGAAKAIADNIIIQLNDPISQYAPNLQKLYEQYPDARIGSMLDDGSFYMMPFIKPDKSVRAVQGFQLRMDWLDKLDLEVPETMEDWYNVLTAIRDEDPNGNGEKDEIPFVMIKNQNIADLGMAKFSGAWGIGLGYYIDNGKVKYGAAEPVYREYLAEMRRWYEEGLIDSDFAITDQKQFDAKITGNQAGAFYGLASGNMGRYMNTMLPTQPDFNLGPALWPTATDGKRYALNLDLLKPVVGEGVGITTKNKHVEETIRWCDYQYGEEGAMLMNFGLEGESYTLENGEPVYTDVVLHNPDGLTPDQAVAKYATTFGASTIYDSRYFNQILTLPQQREALQLWSDAETSLMLPPIAPTAQESSRLASITNELNTYAAEMFNKFIMGQEPLENFDKYLEQINKMGVEEALTIQQAAYERYLNRK